MSNVPNATVIHETHDPFLVKVTKLPVDLINYPPHYQGKGVEVIDVIEGFDLGYHLGNVIKYVLRSRNKGGIEDLKKARWYLDRYIKQLGDG